jgi:hypothetical protein
VGDRSPGCVEFVGNRTWQVSLALLFVSALVWTPGCRRQKLPSQEFAAADRLFVRIYGEKLDDAFLDPRMAQVEQLLSQVGEESADYPAAQQLQSRINAGRQKAQTELNARRELLRSASAPVQMISTWKPSPPVDAGLAQESDAGHEPASGMALGEFTHEFSDCFTPWKPIQLTEKGVVQNTVDSWELKDIANCRDRHPGFQERLVLTDPRKVVMVVRRSMLEVHEADAGAP